jgi:dihydrofolate reductase
MRKLIVSEFLTLDGVFEDPGGAEKTRHGGWQFRFHSPEGRQYKFDELFAVDTLLLGRTTYQGFAAAWPSLKDEDGFADRMNGLPKYVVSTTLADAEWNNSTIIRDNLVETVRQLKEQLGQDIVIYGSGTLVQSLMSLGLIDEYRLMVCPLVLGSGRRFFGEGSDIAALTLVETKTLGAGVVLLVYQSVK